ncbi:hypothetical protein BGZ60DRAFT_405510 [Tricladium varicosporioides]|nr:hypothetical protein BGZ60DRAFT_405510 [Hymenoscyphus varicosporioides]
MHKAAQLFTISLFSSSSSDYLHGLSEILLWMPSPVLNDLDNVGICEILQNSSFLESTRMTGAVVLLLLSCCFSLISSCA